LKNFGDRIERYSISDIKDEKAE